ncbi:DUF2147 domain-containing protein [Chloroherpeton thalassium]|nr:DUF2147 domain-containing protein [Chloroherpeton thalassium]
MKTLKIALLFFVISLFAKTTLAQEFHADDVLGIWYNDEKTAKIEMYKEDEKYHGKIVWLKNPIDTATGNPKVDKNNPDEALRQRPIVGLVLIKNFIFDEDEWEDGEIYDPKNGKTYSCYMVLETPNKLRVRGFIGISLLGRTTYWTRVEDK